MGALFSLVVFAAGTGLVHAQEVGIPHDDYLRAAGLHEEGELIRQKLLAGLKEQSPWLPDSYYENNASFFSMVLVLSGVDPEKYEQLQNGDVDIIHAITADVRPFNEQSLLSDLAVIGTVSGLEGDEHSNDGFDTTVHVSVEEFLKGSAPADSITIRQHAQQRNWDPDTRPEVHSTYLFLLSSGMYSYQAANHQFRAEGEAVVKAPNLGEESRFVIYRMYPVINGQIQNASQDFQSVRKELQGMHRLIHN